MQYRRPSGPNWAICPCYQFTFLPSLISRRNIAYMQPNLSACSVITMTSGPCHQSSLDFSFICNIVSVRGKLKRFYHTRSTCLRTTSDAIGGYIYPSFLLPSCTLALQQVEVATASLVVLIKYCKRIYHTWSR
uniref:Uncharacterized protein n=1 Tax=Arundo donax TaxID=35708 RepID=A0A0A8ZYF7_ARUDO